MHQPGLSTNQTPGRMNADTPVVQLVSPRLTRLLWPNTSGSSIRSDDANRLIIDTSIKGEVRMGVEYDPIRTGKVVSPVFNSGKPVSNGDIEAFADACDLPEHVMGLDVAARRNGRLR